MMHITRASRVRVIAGGMAAGLLGVVFLASGNAAADPVLPIPPAPVPAPPVQNLTLTPGGVTNRSNPSPPAAAAAIPAPGLAPAPIASPIPGTAPAIAPAAVPSMVPPPTPATSGTLRDYFHAKGVRLEPQRPQGFKALDITLPMPPRWTQVPDPNVPDAFAVIADRVGGNSVYTSNAQLVVYKLIGNFDPAEAITHGYLDSQQLLAWQTTNASLSNLGGFPSSIIEGTYRENDMTLNTSRRHVIATAGNDKYLVSLSVTTAASQAVSDAPATDAIVNGFRVTLPGGVAPAPAQAPALAPAQAPTPATTHTPGSATVGLPATAPVPAQVPATGSTPNLLSLVPGLPPLPNLHLTSQR